MKKLLLTSSGLDNKKVNDEFLKLLPKQIREIKVLLVFGVKTEEEMFYVRESKEELVELGILNENILEANINNNLNLEKFRDYEIIYFCGGNTYYLLDRIRKTKFDKLIKESVNEGKLYLGVSAGSIIAGENIDIAGWGSEGDKNEVELKDLSGLEFTNISIFPHYKDELKKEVEDFRKMVNSPVEGLHDGEAILIIGDKIKRLNKK